MGLGRLRVEDLPAAQEEVVLRLVHLLGPEENLGGDLEGGEVAVRVRARS